MKVPSFPGRPCSLVFDALAREQIAHLPTPLEFCPRLTEALGGPEIWIKRDDCTGLAFGGNKTRQLEFIFAEARQQGADTIVIGAGSQSNGAAKPRPQHANSAWTRC